MKDLKVLKEGRFGISEGRRIYGKILVVEKEQKPEKYTIYDSLNVLSVLILMF